MTNRSPEPDPHSELEDEGIPDLQDGTPGQEWAVDPQQAPVPRDHPIAVDDFGTTIEEQIEGEPLDLRVAREQPEEQPVFDANEVPEAPPDDPGETAGDREDSLIPDSGLGVGADLSTDYEPGPGPGPEWPGQLEEPSGQVWDDPRPAGRLVAPDEGAHPIVDGDPVADEVGPDIGGYTGEEAAMRVEPE
jgi:hypothetical protein